MKLARMTLFFLLTLIVALSFFRPVSAQSLVLTLTINNSVYELGEQVIISGNLTLSGNPVTDGLVAIQLQDPRNGTMVMRTLETGTDPPRPWTIEVLDFHTVGLSGEPKTSFRRGDVVGFDITLKNNVASSQKVLAPVYIQYADNRPFISFVLFTGTIDGGNSTEAVGYVSIPDNAPIGTTHAYASALTDYPIKNGYAYSPETPTTFEITNVGLSGSGIMLQQDYLAGGGNFSMSFMTNWFGGILGNYTIYATSWYMPHFISSQATFRTVLTGDITGPISGVPDGKIDARDVSRIAKAYGSRPGNPKWDPICDITGPVRRVPDGLIDARDVALVAHSYGRYGSLP